MLLAWLKRRRLKNSPYETCVICNELTEERKDTPLSQRKNYVAGCGTLCNACYLAVYQERRTSMKDVDLEELLTVTREGTEK